MKSFHFLLALSGLCIQSATAQDSTHTRLAVTTTISRLTTTDVAEAGWQVRQQLAYFPTSRLGVAVGLSWGNQAQVGRVKSLIASDLLQTYTRSLNTADLGLLVRLADSRRHALTLLGGLALVTQKTVRVDGVYPTSSNPAASLPVRLVTTDRHDWAPLVGLAYQYKLSARFGMGAEGRMIWVPKGQRISTLGLSATYRFNVSAASLGLPAVPVDERLWGIRAAVNFSGNYERSVGEIWLPLPVAGLWAELPISLTWTMRGELSYAGRGVERERVEFGTTAYLPTSSRVNYLDMSLLFKNELRENWYVFVGPHLSFFLNGMYQSGGTAYPVDKGINSGLTLGMSVNLTRRLALDARYVRDIIRFSSEPYGGYQGFQFGTNMRLSK